MIQGLDVVTKEAKAEAEKEMKYEMKWKRPLEPVKKEKIGAKTSQVNTVGKTSQVKDGVKPVPTKILKYKMVEGKSSNSKSDGTKGTSKTKKGV